MVGPSTLEAPNTGGSKAVSSRGNGPDLSWIPGRKIPVGWSDDQKREYIAEHGADSLGPLDISPSTSSFVRGFGSGFYSGATRGAKNEIEFIQETGETITNTGLGIGSGILIGIAIILFLRYK